MSEERPKRKTHTSTEVKRRYNEKTYKQWNAPIRKEDFERIEAMRGDMSRAAFLKMLVERYTNDKANEIERANKFFEYIDTLPPEDPTPEELAAIEAAEAEGYESFTPLEDVMKDLGDLEPYSGKLVIRLPRSLHRRLKLEAKREGVSLNQYMLYKLAQ